MPRVLAGIDEDDPSGDQGIAHSAPICRQGRTPSGFEIEDGRLRHTRSARQLSLRPVEERSACAALLGGADKLRVGLDRREQEAGKGFVHQFNLLRAPVRTKC